MFVGLNPVQSGVESGADITVLIINNRGVRQIFTNLVAFATIMLIFFTILQIIREHYKDKHGGNPYVLVFRMVKAMVLFMFVTAACVIGLQLSSVVLRALDRATGYDPDGGIGGVIFVAMVAQGNRVSQGIEARTMRQPDLVSDQNLYAATIAHNREKGWVWTVSPESIQIFYGADPNNPYEGEVKYPLGCPHWYIPWCRCTPGTSPAFAEEQTATGQIMSNRFMLTFPASLPSGAVPGAGLNAGYEGRRPLKNPIRERFYIIRFDIEELANGPFSAKHAREAHEGGEEEAELIAIAARDHGGFGAVRNLFGKNSWHRPHEIFNHNLPIFVMDQKGQAKRVARAWNNKNTRNEHKGFARITRHPVTGNDGFGPSRGKMYSMADPNGPTAGSADPNTGDAPRNDITDPDNLFYEDALWKSGGANNVDAYYKFENAGGAIESINSLMVDLPWGTGTYHYYAITVDRRGRPINKNLRDAGMLSASYFHLTNEGGQGLVTPPGSVANLTMFNYWYMIVRGNPGGELSYDYNTNPSLHWQGNGSEEVETDEAHQLPEGEEPWSFMDLSTTEQEDYANWIDNMFKRRRNVTEYLKLFDDERWFFKRRSYGQMKYTNIKAVFIMYDKMSFNWIVGFGGLFVAMGVYNSFAFAMIQRIAELGILYMFSPVTLAFFPFDDGAQFNNAFVKPFYRKAISSYAPVLSLNLFFVILPAFDAIRWFQNGILNTITKCIVSIALLSMLPKVRTTIQTMLGADPMEEKKMFGKGGVINPMGMAKKAVDTANRMNTAKQMWANKRLGAQQEKSAERNSMRDRILKEGPRAGETAEQHLARANAVTKGGIAGAAARAQARSQMNKDDLNSQVLEGEGVKNQETAERKRLNAEFDAANPAPANETAAQKAKRLKKRDEHVEKGMDNFKVDKAKLAEYVKQHRDDARFQGVAGAQLRRDQQAKNKRATSKKALEKVVAESGDLTTDSGSATAADKINENKYLKKQAWEQIAKARGIPPDQMAQWVADRQDRNVTAKDLQMAARGGGKAAVYDKNGRLVRHATDGGRDNALQSEQQQLASRVKGLKEEKKKELETQRRDKIMTEEETKKQVAIIMSDESRPIEERLKLAADMMAQQRMKSVAGRKEKVGVPEEGVILGEDDTKLALMAVAKKHKVLGKNGEVDQDELNALSEDERKAFDAEYKSTKQAHEEQEGRRGTRTHRLGRYSASDLAEDSADLDKKAADEIAKIKADKSLKPAERDRQIQAVEEELANDKEKLGKQLDHTIAREIKKERTVVPDEAGIRERAEKDAQQMLDDIKSGKRTLGSVVEEMTGPALTDDEKKAKMKNEREFESGKISQAEMERRNDAIVAKAKADRGGMYADATHTKEEEKEKKKNETEYKQGKISHAEMVQRNNAIDEAVKARGNGANAEMRNAVWGEMDAKAQKAAADEYWTSTEGKADLKTHVDSINETSVKRRTGDDKQRAVDNAKLKEYMADGLIPDTLTDKVRQENIDRGEAWKNNLYDKVTGARLEGTALQDAFQGELNDPNNGNMRGRLGIDTADVAAAKQFGSNAMRGVGKVAGTLVNPFKMVDATQSGLAKLRAQPNMFGTIMDGLFDPDNGVLMQNELAKMLDSMSFHQTFTRLDDWEQKKTSRQKTEAFAKARTYRFTGAFASTAAEQQQMEDDLAFRSGKLGMNRPEIEKRHAEMKQEKERASDELANIVKNTGQFGPAIDKLLGALAKKGDGPGTQAYKDKEKEINNILNTGSKQDFQRLFGADGDKMYAKREKDVFGNPAAMADINKHRATIRDFERADGLAKNSKGEFMDHNEYIKSTESRRNQLAEYHGNGMRVLGISEADTRELSAKMATINDPNGEYIKNKRAYEANQKPEVEINGKMVTLDSTAAFAKYQKHVMADYESAVRSKVNFPAVAFRDYGEKTGDRMDGVMGATMAGEQVKLMQDTVWKTSKETHQIFRDKEFVDMIEKSQWQKLADQFHAAATGQENVFDKDLLSKVTKKSELADIGNMFKNMLGDAGGEMRGEGFSVAQNIIARTFRMAFVDQITESLKATQGMLDQQQLQAFTARDDLVTALKGATDSATKAMINGCDVSQLQSFGFDDFGAIDAMQKKMQDNLNAQRSLNAVEKQALQDKLNKLFSSTVQNLKLRQETNDMTYRIRHLTDLDFSARNAVDRKADKMQFGTGGGF